MRIDHCHFDHLHQAKAIGTKGWSYGVADHNVIECLSGTYSFFISAYNHGGPNQTNGNGAWADLPWYGTDKFFFAEDNRIEGNGLNTNSGNSDTFYGSRYVFRHNYWKNAQPNSHGTEGGTARGGRAYECYDNTFEWTIPTPGAGQRSGTSLWHDNRFIGVKPSKLCSLPNYREIPARPQPVWGIADGTSVWDANDTEGNGTFVEGHPPFVFASGSVTGASVINGDQGTFTDSSKNWTPNQWVGYSIKNLNLSSAYGSYIISNAAHTITYSYYRASDAATHLIFNVGNTYQIHRVLNMMDQNGSGKGDQITGLSQPINTRTGAASYNHQAVEPCNSWNNMHTDGTALGYDNNDAQPTTKEGRDYFNLGGGFPANTTPAVVSSRYTAALNGVDYTGTFTYPHPLVSVNPTPTPTSTPIPTPTPTPTASPTITPTATETPTPTPSATPTPTATPTGTPTPTRTPTPTPAPTRSPTPTCGSLNTDFNHDGKPDYVLYNGGTRQTAMYYLNNNILLGTAFGPTLPAGWRLVGVGDFNRDGKTDYALFNPSTRQTRISYLSGVTRIGGNSGPTLPSGWQLVAVGKFNGDCKPDYVLYNATTRQTAVWYMNDNVFLSGVYGPTLPAGWSLVGVGDFNRDGKTDYLLFNAATRQSAIWYLSGVTFVSGAYGPMIASGYGLQGTADFNRDGKPDYVLYNSSSRRTAIWYLNNNVFLSGVYGPTLSAGWSLVAP
jgi:hypothetical protein